MAWVYRIGLAVLFGLVAVAAEAEDQPKYATMARGWSPYQAQPASVAQQQPALPQPPPAQAPQQPLQEQAHLIQPPQPDVPETVTVTAPALPKPAPYAGDTNEYRLGTGDKVRITVFGEDDLSGEFQVDSTGFLRVPMIGQVRAAGFTARDLEGSITQSYADGYLTQPRVNIEIMTYRPFYIIGEVNKPGEYAYVNGMNVLNAVALAGGFTSRAVESHVYVRKNGIGKEMRISADQSVRVMPGDIVRVTSSPLWDVLSIVTPLAGFAPRY